MSGWIQHVKKVQAKNKISYKDAMKVASKTYMKGGMRRATADSGGRDPEEVLARLGIRRPPSPPRLPRDPRQAQEESDPRQAEVPRVRRVESRRAQEVPRYDPLLLHPQEAHNIRLQQQRIRDEEQRRARREQQAYDAQQRRLTGQQELHARPVAQRRGHLQEARAERVFAEAIPIADIDPDFKPFNPGKLPSKNITYDRAERQDMIGEGMKSKNNWIQHVKSVQAKHGISYKDAMKVASKTYKR